MQTLCRKLRERHVLNLSSEVGSYFFTVALLKVSKLIDAFFIQIKMILKLVLAITINLTVGRITNR